MKKVTYLLTILMLVATTAFASGDTQEFEVNGLKVIFKHSPKEVISARLFIEGGATNYPKAKEGIEALTLSLMMNGGTQTLDKTAFNTEAEKIGTSFSTTASYDYADINMTCIKMFWDKSWALFADAIMNPAFDPKEFKLTQEQMITTAKSVESDPDSYLKDLSMKFAFEGTSNAKTPDGTAESLAAITLDDVKKYYKEVIGKKKMFLVVVGNLDEKNIKDHITNSLAKLPTGTPAKTEPRKLITTSGDLVVDRDIATNYIRGLMSAPKLNEKDGIPMQLGMSILYDRYFLELRTNRSLSYAPAAFYSSGVLGNPYNVIYISTQKPEEAMKVMVDIINDVKKNGFTADELKNKQQKFLTNYYMGLETSASQSSKLGIYELLGGYEMADEFTNTVNATNLTDINRVFDKYTKAIKWVYLGKQDDVKKEDFKQVEESVNKPY